MYHILLMALLGDSSSTREMLNGFVPSSLETRTKQTNVSFFNPFLAVGGRGRCRADWTMMMGRCGKLLLFLLQWFLSQPAGVMSSTSNKGRRRPADLLLKMHELYTRQPPHDTSLYDLLEVSPNATYAEIAKSYRQITRRLHPDKQVGRRRRKKGGGHNAVVGTDNTNDNEDIDGRPDQKLARVRAAYEILKHDSRRLPYHRHGLLNPMDAVYILTGKHSVGGGSQQLYPRHGVLAVDDDHSDDEHEKHVLQMELLELMGYYNYIDIHHQRKRFPFFSDQRPSSFSGDYHPEQRSKRDRVHFIAASLLERLVPVIEGSLPEHVFLDHLIQQCDRWKSLPLGAQIVRCIGRAYRYEGERFLRQGMPLASVQDGMRSMMRQAKYFAHAAVAGGRVVLEERKVVAAQQQQTTTSPHLAINDRPGQHWEDDTEEESELLLSCETIHKQELDQAHQAVLESLQVEALWKICKIDLDRTIRTACHVLLDGPPPTAPTTTGWIGQKNGNAVLAHHGRIQLALLLVRMGNIMVHRSKEGTAWME
jgi:curved DNA-binding protein CbpA